MMSRRLFATGSTALLALAQRARASAQASSAPLDVPTFAPKVALAPVSVLYAGSLVDVMEHRVAAAVASVGVRFLGEGKGSVALAREIEGGERPADVFISADTKVLDALGAGTGAKERFASWYATFAATRLVLGYSRRSPFAALFARIAKGQAPLSEAFTASNVRVGRTDPALDPKGYRSILAMRLLEMARVVPQDFTQTALGDARNPSQILPEETLLTRLETGDVDIAFLYRTEAVERKLPVIELPKEANLGDPALAATYARASVRIGDTVRTGAPATYAVTILSGAPNEAPAETFAAWLLGDAGRRVLAAAGVDVLPPVVHGDRTAVPAGLRAALGIS